MDDAIVPQATREWALALVVGFPVTMLILGELIVRLNRRQNPLASTVRIFRSAILPTVALLVLLRQIVGRTDSATSVRLVETLLWIFLIHAGLSFVNDTAFVAAAKDSWRSRVPRLLIDLVRLFLVLVGAGVVLSAVWRFDLGSIATALGVGSVVIGLALQEPLGNVFSGIMLMFERPFAVGDWIKLEGTLGKVCEINWRAIHLETDTEELVIVPNAVLSKGSFVNLSRPTKQHREEVFFAFPLDAPPNTVKTMLRETVQGTEGVAAVPAPTFETLEYKDGVIRYKVSFVVHVEQRDAIRDEVQTRVWYAAKRSGLSLASPVLTIMRVGRADGDKPNAFDAHEALRSFPLFRLVSREQLEGIFHDVVMRRYAKGEPVIGYGERFEGLHLVLSGTAIIRSRDAVGGERELARVSQGEFFGEGSLLSGSASDTSVVAFEDLSVLVVKADALHRLLDESPRLAREIGTVMDVRRNAAQAARSASATEKRSITAAFVPAGKKPDEMRA